MSFEPAQVETVTVDSYGTLVDPGAAERAVAAYTDDPDPLLAHWRAKYLSYVMIANDVDDYRPFDELIGAALEQALGAFDIETTAAEREEILAAYDDLDPFDDVRDGLARIAAEYDVYVLSMGTPEMLDLLVGTADIEAYVEDTISVHEIRTYKPEAAVYRHAAARTGTPIEHVAHVAGPTFDVRGAMAAGMQGVWVDRTGEPWDPWFPDPDLAVDTLADVADALDVCVGPTSRSRVGSTPPIRASHPRSRWFLKVERGEVSTVMSTATQSTCPECDGQLREDATETVCGECGLVVAEDAIDRGPEWRAFSDDDRNPERCGAPLTRSRHDRGLSTEIGRTVRLKGRKRRRVARLRREHNRTKIHSKRERNQVYAFTEIRRLTAQLDLPDSVRDRACVLFESAQEADLLPGRSLEGFAAAAVYAVCRTSAVSRTRREILAAAKATDGELDAAYDALNRELGLQTGPIDPREYLARFASKLDLVPDVERRARALAAAGADAGLVNGRNPSGFAAACLYTAATETGHDLTQAAAADVADVSTVTLRSAATDLSEL